MPDVVSIVLVSALDKQCHQLTSLVLHALHLEPLTMLLAKQLTATIAKANPSCVWCWTAGMHIHMQVWCM